MSPARPNYRERFFYALLNLSRSSKYGVSYIPFDALVKVVKSDARALRHRLGPKMTQHVNLALDDAVALGYAELHPRQDDFIRVTDRGRQLLRSVRRVVRGRSYTTICDMHRSFFAVISDLIGPLPDRPKSQLVKRVNRLQVHVARLSGDPASLLAAHGSLIQPGGTPKPKYLFPGQISRMLRRWVNCGRRWLS